MVRLFAQKVYPARARTRPQWEGCHCADDGRAALEPVVMPGVSPLQYLEAVPNRQAAEMLRYHAGWNFALTRQAGDKVFHPTTLVHFRQRLLDHEPGAIGFAAVPDALVEAGLVARRSRQRLDSTQMFGRISRMSRLDCVRASLRLTLLELSEELPPAGRPGWWPLLWERQVETQTDYRASLETLSRKMAEAGADARQLLGWLATPAAKGLAGGAQARLLARVFAEQFEVVAGSGAPQTKTKEQLSSERGQNPHDPDATCAAKGQGERKKEHVGCKVQVAETVGEAALAPGEPTRNFIGGIVTQAARESDEEGAAKMELEQQALGLEKPPVQEVDAACLSARKLEEAAPGRVSYRFEWDTATCAACPLRPQCVKATDQRRTLVVGEHHTALQTRRLDQQTKPFRQRMRHRNAIEGTQGELVRAHGLRRARDRGLAEARLQNYFGGAACDIKRWLRRAAWEKQNGLNAKLGPVAAG